VTVGLFGVTVVVMSENVGKLVGVVVMAVLVVVGVAVSSGDDTNFTRNAAFVKLGDFQQLPEAEQARLAPAFLEQAAPKALDTGPINKINKEVGPIFKGATGYKLKNVIVTSLEASVLEGKGVDGKGGTASIQSGCGWNGKTCKAGFVAWPSADSLSGRKANIMADAHRHQLKSKQHELNADNANSLIEDGIEACVPTGVGSLKNVMITSYSMENTKDLACLPQGGTSANLNQKSEQLTNFDQKTNQLRVGKDEAGLLAACMDSKVGDVFLKSHIESMAADCVATVMPALSPDRAKRLGTYWQTQEQLARIGSEHCWPCE